MTRNVGSRNNRVYLLRNLIVIIWVVFVKFSVILITVIGISKNRRSSSRSKKKNDKEDDKND